MRRGEMVKRVHPNYLKWNHIMTQIWIRVGGRKKSEERERRETETEVMAISLDTFFVPQTAFGTRFGKGNEIFAPPQLSTFSV